MKFPFRRRHATTLTLTAVALPTGQPIENLVDTEQYPYPHCNSEVLHAPGACRYCDLYPTRQRARINSRTPFTPAAANGWHGNIALP